MVMRLSNIILRVGCLWWRGILSNSPTLRSRAGPIFEPACGEDLAERLSSGARIYCPGSEQFHNATQRWSTLRTPTFMMTVEVTTERDVLEVVKYANQKDIPFLPVNSAHGAIITVGELHNGIRIGMRQLNSIQIAEDGQTATFGGGILDKDVTSGLWAAGKQTVTGGCECVSLIVPGLGGGHGFLQARHGLVSDQFVSLNMIMADGTLQKIDHNHELWWAVRGAGHNFGLVTSITMKIYDVKYPKWAFQNFTFSGDKVESLYTTINKHLLKDGVQSIDLFHHSFPSASSLVDGKPVIILYILQEGVETVNADILAPFLALEPVTTFSGNGGYPDVPDFIGWGNAAGSCPSTGFAVTRFPIELEFYDIDAQRSVYDLFSSTLKQEPAFNGSSILFEGYSQQGVKAIPRESSAYPFRGSNLLVAPVVRFIEGEEELTKKAIEFGEALRDILHKASGQKKKRTYLNYALGTESLQEIYGAEQWRQAKLLALKKKYDPYRKFSYYAPIA